VLLPGECVTAWKDNKKTRPSAITCNEVGLRLTRAPKGRFWKSTFGVYYNEVWIANCDSELCGFTLPVEPQGAAASTGTEFGLVFARHGEDSLFVINQSTRAFPLVPLRLGEGDGAINGAEWGVLLLLPGECVTAWKDGGKPKAPDVACHEVGPRVVREPRERFWKSTFGVYYNEAWIANCDSEYCAFRIPG
jgi:hypothetical protein